jgi:parallel beta-helix repeat protein
MTITTVGTAAALSTALKSAASGDTILLAPGTYSSLSLSNLHFAQDVTIQSQYASNPAVMTGLTLTYSNGLTFKGLDFKVGSSDNPFQVGASQDIHFVGLDVHGSMDGNATNDRAAFLVRSSSNISFENSEFQQLSAGVGHLNSDHIVISGNEFHDIVVDGVRGGGSSYVTIANNDFHDFYPTPGVHPDMIQFWTTNTTRSAHDIVITGNSMMRGDGSTAQGIFIGDEVGSLPYANVKISGNLLSGTAYNGIFLGHAGNVTVTNNIVQGL